MDEWTKESIIKKINYHTSEFEYQIQYMSMKIIFKFIHTGQYSSTSKILLEHR